MKFNVRLTDQPALVRVDVYENITGELQREFTLAAVLAARDAELDQFLVDVHRVSNLSTLSDQFNFAYDDVPLMRLEKGAKIAVIVSPHDLSHDFIRIALCNAGYDCAFFNDETEALNWLS